MSRVLSRTPWFGGIDPSALVPLLPADHNAEADRASAPLNVSWQCPSSGFSGSSEPSNASPRYVPPNLCEMLTACPYAALACDERARLIACNGSASALLRDGLAVVGGRVTICDGLVHKRFLRLLNAHAAAQPAALLVPRPSGRPSLQMLLSETAAAGGRAADDGLQRLWKVVISDPSNIAPATVQAFSSLFGLTPAEVRLAQQLLLGATLQEAACRAQVKISTVRSQLNTLLRKTGTRRQAELVRVLSVVPA